MKKITTVLFLLLGVVGLNAQVGIGTTSPTEALDVETNDATKTAIDINNSSTGDPLIHFQVSGIARFTIGVDNDDSDKFKIGSSALETSTALTINSSQQVGIGNTAPTATLDVDGSAIFNEGSNSVDFRVESNSNTHMFYIDGTNDNIGIGTSAPSVELEIAGNAEMLRLNCTNHGFITWYQDGDGSSRTGYIGHALSTDDDLSLMNETAAGDIILGTNTTTRVVIDESGNVGIGNTSPTARLDVDGSAIFNEGSNNVDFRIESDGNTHMFFLDASADGIGIGTNTPASGLDIQRSMGLAVASISSATTLDQTHNVVLVDASGGGFTVTLPAAASNEGKVYYIKESVGSTNTITIDGNGAETIDGSATQTITSAYGVMRIVCNGSAWFIVSN